MKHQTRIWLGKFGKEYTIRNTYQTYIKWNSFYQKRYGINKEKLNKIFLNKLDKNIKILEIGCNVGQQLNCLHKMGFKNLYGIEIQDFCMDFLRKNKNIKFVQASAYNLPFNENFFDLVFTHNVLIHFPPKNIKEVLVEIHRVTKKWIWGLEYFSKRYSEVIYRKKKKMLWKANFLELFTKNFNDLKIKKNKSLLNISNKKEVDIMYLLKKG